MKIKTEIVKHLDLIDLDLFTYADQKSAAFFCVPCKESYVNYDTKTIKCELCGEELENINEEFAG